MENLTLAWHGCYQFLGERAAPWLPLPCPQMNRWGYIYVENLTWVWLAPSSGILAQPAPLLRSSHLTLFLFRKEGAFPGRGWSGLAGRQ